MTTGFLEIPGNMVVESRERGAGAGIAIGEPPYYSISETTP
jgi:hypothetical protein